MLPTPHIRTSSCIESLLRNYHSWKSKYDPSPSFTYIGFKSLHEAHTRMHDACVHYKYYLKQARRLVSCMCASVWSEHPCLNLELVTTLAYRAKHVRAQKKLYKFCWRRGSFHHLCYLLNLHLRYLVCIQDTIIGLVTIYTIVYSDAFNLCPCMCHRWVS